jgi:hypothetical protein
VVNIVEIKELKQIIVSFHHFYRVLTMVGHS